MLVVWCGHPRFSPGYGFDHWLLLRCLHKRQFGTFRAYRFSNHVNVRGWYCPCASWSWWPQLFRIQPQHTLMQPLREFPSPEMLSALYTECVGDPFLSSRARFRLTRRLGGEALPPCTCTPSVFNHRPGFRHDIDARHTFWTWRTACSLPIVSNNFEQLSTCA